MCFVNVALAQSNDNFSGRMVLTGTSWTAQSTSFATATVEPGEPSAHTRKSVWLSWNAPADLRVSLNLAGSNLTTGSPDTYVYVGDSLNTLYRVISGGGTTPASWVAVKGVSYHIAFVASGSSETGTVVASLTSSPFNLGSKVIGPDISNFAAPVNDSFANRKQLIGLPLTVIAYHGGATRETAEPTSTRSGTLWYSYTATADVWLRITLEAELADSYITVFNGDSFPTLQLVGSMDSGSISVVMAAGSTYQICVANYGSAATNISQVAFSTSPISASGVIVGPEAPLYNAPNNDSFSLRKALTGNRLTVFGYNTQASNESFEPSGARYNTLWYKWGTNQAGNVTVTLQEYGFDAYLSIWKGNDLGSLQLIRAADSGVITFAAEANAEYQIALSSYSGSVGLASFDINGPGTGIASGVVNSTRFINLSTRSVIATGANLNPGFVISGTSPKNIIVRGVGPGLAALGVPGTLPDPTITVYSGSTVIATNDDWSANAATAAALRNAFVATGAFALPDGSKDAALLLTVNPGAYTVILKDSAGRAGDAIVEVYDVP